MTVHAGEPTLLPAGSYRALWPLAARPLDEGHRLYRGLQRRPGHRDQLPDGGGGRDYGLRLRLVRRFHAEEPFRPGGCDPGIQRSPSIDL